MVPRVASDAYSCRRYGRLERMPPRFCTLELQEQDYKDSLCVLADGTEREAAEAAEAEKREWKERRETWRRGGK